MMYSGARITSLSLGLFIIALASGCGAMRGGAEIEGTYRFVSRDLPDGTVQTPPAVEGLLTYTDHLRNFNIHWTDESGKHLSIGAVCEYVLTAGDYTETNIFYVMNDEISGAGLTYDLSNAAGAAPVTRAGGELRFTLPLHGEPSVVFTRDGLTATREGEFVDHWEKVDD